MKPSPAHAGRNLAQEVEEELERNVTYRGQPQEKQHRELELHVIGALTHTPG